MERLRLRKLTAAVGTLMLVLIASSSYAEQYEAISTDSRSLRYTNTFGLFNNDYDVLVNPRLLSRLQGHRVITNLTNVDDADEFQLGYGGRPVGPGNVAGVLSFGTQARDSYMSITEVEFEDRSGDDVDDTKYEYTYTGRHPYDFQIQNNLDGYLGYGYMLQSDTGLGIGLGLNRSSVETDYWEETEHRRGEMYIRRNVSNPNGFPGWRSNFLEWTEVVTNLETDEGMETRNGKKDGTMKRSGSEIDVLLGADHKFGPSLTASADVIIGLGSLKDEGTGTFTTKTEIEGSSYGESLNSSLKETLNSMRRYGVAAELQYSANPEHLIHFDLGFEGSPGKIKDSEITEVYHSWETTAVTEGTYEQTETYAGERSGNTDKSTLLVVSLRDNYTISDIISLGFGGELQWGKVTCDYTDSGTYDSIEVYDDNGIYGDTSNDYTETESANMSRDISAETSTMIFAFPVSAIIKVTKKLEFRLGARYSHIIIKSEFSDNLASYEGVSGRTVWGGGWVEEWQPDSEEDFDYTAGKVKYETTNSQVDVRAGLGYDPSENFELELLFYREDEYENGYSGGSDGFLPFSFNDGDYEASPIYAVYFSGTLKFQ